MDKGSLVEIAEVLVGAALAIAGGFALLRPKLLSLIRDRESLAGSEEEIGKLRDRLNTQEERLHAKEQQIGSRKEALDEREDRVSETARLLDQREKLLQDRLSAAEIELERISCLDKDSAREIYLARIGEEFREIGAQRARAIEQEASLKAESKGKMLILEAMERNAAQYVTEATLAVITLPSEDMKGRIIGRDGRNIRAFEQTTGVDLIVDETPESVVISCFDPVRREVAKVTLLSLIADGRIHPGRIEELHEKAGASVQAVILNAGDSAAERAGISGLSPRIIETMGRLRFRTSYAQNVLDHSVEVSELCSSIAGEMQLNVEVAKRSGFLHDIGKALGSEWEGPHALTGMEFLLQQGEKESVARAVGAHHHDIEPSSPEAHVLIVADSISSSRPGARRESLDNYVKRLAALEALASRFPAVERAYALQAGREIRLLVKPEVIDDLGAARLASEVARTIESEMEYPGQIKVTVIRETRVHDVAK